MCLAAVIWRPTGRPPVVMPAGTEMDGFQHTLANIVKGLGSLYRNPVAHDPRTRREVSDKELLELLTALSMGLATI